MKSRISKTFSWIHFAYEFREKECFIHIETSDVRKLTYKFIMDNDIYQLTSVEGSSLIPVSYEYAGVLIKKNLPEGRFIEIEYEQDKVQSLKGPSAQSGELETIHLFSYGKDYTDVFDAMGVKTRYIYDKRFQLTAIEWFDNQNKLYRNEQKFWGKTKHNAGLLLAKTIGDGANNIYSYRSFNYDKFGNVIEERLYGNLTGKKESFLQLSSDGILLNSDEEECHLKTFEYSIDGYNLLTKVGDCKGNQTLYTYKLGTNFLIKKLIFDKGNIKKRMFQFFNEEGIHVKTIEDDGSEEKESDLYKVTERHIKEMITKEILPGIGLPEIIEEKALDLKTKQEILIRRVINTYDNQSNLLSCSTYDAKGEYAFTEKRTYSAIGQIISQVDGIGREFNYSYDEVGNEISRFILHEDKYINTVYDFHNRPIKITQITKEEEFSLYNTYDVLGRKISSRDRFGNTTYYEYDAFHRLIKIIHPKVFDENSQIIRPTFHYTYDILGNVLTTEDPKGFITKKSYNLRGDPIKVSYPDGSFELFKYDTEGSLHRSLTREQIVTVYEYDYLGRSIYEESSTIGETGVSSFLISRSHQYNGFRCISEKEDDYVKRYSFDPAGNLISMMEFMYGQNEGLHSRLTAFIYDSFGRVHERRVWFDIGPEDFSIECFEYDLSGNIIEKRIEDAKRDVLLQKYYAYNLQDQCIEEYKIEKGIKTQLAKTIYNASGEPIAYFDGLGNKTKVLIDHTYQNALGQTISKKIIINPLGVQTEIEFDALGRVYSISKKDSFGIVLSSQKNLYDSLGNKACEIHDQIVDGNVIGSQKIQWKHGVMGRLEEEIQASDSSLEKKVYYEYNSLGKLISKTVTGSTTPIQYTYNKDGKLHKIEAQNSKKELQISNSYSYDRKGNILSAYSLYGKSIQRTYNAFSQVIKETIKDGEGSYVLQYAYDRKGRLKEIILPDSSKIAYIYDAVFGRAVNRISSQGNILYTHTYDNYDAQGKLLAENYIGYAGSQEYDYNLNGKKISSKNDFFQEEYTRDRLGRIVEIKGENKEEYIYNALSQLILEKKLSTKTYAYDSLDNRIKEDNDSLFYNTLNQLTSSSKTLFSYDSQGNLLRKILDEEETRFESNILSQLTLIEKTDQTALTFSYDPFGRLLVEKHLDIKGKNKVLSISRYFYLGYQEIGTLSQKEVIETLKIPGLDGDGLASTSIAFEIKGETFLPLHDIAGNVLCLIDPQSRQIVESYHYSTFGEESIFNEYGEKEELSSVGNPWRFAEKRVDERSGLILFGFRFYDPKMGRWISQDPVGFSDGLNLYAYLHNNPLNNLDRFGLTTESNSTNKFDEYFYGEVESHCFCEKHRTCKRGGDIGKTAGSSLPKITYDDYFEKYYKDYRSKEFSIKDCYENSTYYDLSKEGFPNLSNDLGIGFINGIWNDFKASKASVQYLSKLAGGYNIHGVYNASHGTNIDILECGLGLNYIATEPVRQLHSMWNNFFDKNSAKAKFLMICHSQGVIHVRNALLDYPPELRERILVVAIAPGGYIYQETCAKVIHYRAKPWRDFVPRLDRAGSKREKNTIVDLNSHADASYFDHEFMSPTYREVIRWHITNYINTQGKK